MARQTTQEKNRKAWVRRKKIIAADSVLRRRLNRGHRDYLRSRNSTPEGWAKVKFTQLKSSCARKSMAFDLEVGDLIPPTYCPVLGMKLILSTTRNNPSIASIDRLISKNGYIKGNIRIISLRANILKRDCVDPSELRAVADYMEREYNAGS